MSETYYINFINNKIEDASLCDGVVYENNVLSFDSKDPISLTIHYSINQDTTITYHISKNVHVNLIEEKNITHASLKKEVYLDEDAVLHTFVNNISNTLDNTHEEVYHLKENASSQTGYAELSDESLNAKYSYELDGEGASSYVRMAILSKEKENKKYEVSIKHNAPNTTGNMDNYGVVKDAGYLTIDGVGTITKGQHGSESHQTNKIMVFDKDCYASANPYLFIDEYDVKASHAAGVGKMDEEHLYYLQSRGLTKKQSMQLITYGYLKPVIEVIEDEMIRSQFESILSKVGD